MELLSTNLATKPRIRKTTLRLPPEARAVADKLPQRTLNKAITNLLMLVGKQQRNVPGHGPLPHREFCAQLGIDGTLPPEYRYTAKERELFRRERDKLVGAPRSWFEVDQVEQLPEVDQVEQLPEVDQVEQLPEVDQVEQLPAQIQILKTVCEKQNKLRAVFGAIDEQEHPVDFAARAERVRELIELLAVCAPASLARVQKDYPGMRPTRALESELATLVQIYGDKLPKTVKRRIWRDLS